MSSYSLSYTPPTALASRLSLISMLVQTYTHTPAHTVNNTLRKLVKKNSYEPRHKETCLWGLRPGKTQTASAAKEAR